MSHLVKESEPTMQHVESLMGDNGSISVIHLARKIDGSVLDAIATMDDALAKNQVTASDRTGVLIYTRKNNPSQT